MSIENLYERYIKAYEIEVRECSTIQGRKSLKDLSMLEDLSLEEFKEKLKDEKFNRKWGDDPNDANNFMYNWIRSKSGR
jgi:predicted HTH domain antitoxin